MLFSLVALLGLFLLWMYRLTRRPKNYPPGPVRFPFFGSFLSLDIQRPSQTFKKWSEKFGKIYSVKLGSQELVILNDPALVKESMMTSADFTERPSAYNLKFFYKHKNVGLVLSTGSVWKEHRRFSLRHLRDFGLGKSSVEDIVKSEVSEQIQRLDKTLGEPVELDWDFNIGVTNIIWTLTAGRRFDVASQEMQDFHSSLCEILQLQSDLSILGYFPILLYILPKSILKLDRALEINANFLGFIKAEIENHKQTFKMDGVDGDLIDVYLRKLEEDSSGPTFNREEEEFNLLAVMADLFAAGGETTYTTLRWAFTYLIKYPHIQKKLQDELDDVVGRYRTITLDDKASLPYLEAFIMEVQRTSNILPLALPHVASKDSVIDGYAIPKGTQVIANTSGIHYNPKFWGDPENFRPERFLNGNKIVKNDALMPFGLGRRQCLGESLARTELFLFISCLLQQFSFTSAVDTDDISLESGAEALIRYPKRNKMILTRRK